MLNGSSENNPDILKGEEIDGIDHLAALKKDTPGPRTSVHIHRDWDRDGHAYRSGPWKIIVGNHGLPFFFTKVYNETSSWWLVENGSLRDKALQLVLEALDTLIGTENTIFLQYFLWVVFDSFNVGGLHRVRSAAGRRTNKIEQELYKTDLPHYQAEQEKDPAYPVVSLFNLEEDPQETNNLANTYPDLVKKLLEEAEDAVANAPKQWRGDMVHAQAPVSEQQGWIAVLRSLGTCFDEVIPFGIYLSDDEDLENLEYVRLVEEEFLNNFTMALKTFVVFIILPILLVFAFLKYSV